MSARIRNIGPTSAAWLRQVGVTSLEDLERVGTLHTYLRVRALYPGTSLNLLWALEAAVLDIDWRDLPVAIKEGCRQQLADLGLDEGPEGPA